MTGIQILKTKGPAHKNLFHYPNFCIELNYLPVGFVASDFQFFS